VIAIPREIDVFGAPVDCTVAVPGSKSIANRALVCAAFAGGGTVVANVPDGDDSAAMVRGLRSLGVDVVETGDGVVRFESGLDVDLSRVVRVDAGLAGTTSRFLTAVCALRSTGAVIDGGEALRGRPMADLHDALAALGAHVNPLERPGHLPVEVSAGGIRGGEIEIPGGVSSQFATALLLVAPYLRGGLRLVVAGERVSDSYLEMTVEVMRDFGVDAVINDTASGRVVTVPEGRYVARHYEVEPDASSASYPMAIAAVCGGSVTIPNLTVDSLQGDVAFADILEEMGCRVERGLTSISVHRDLDQPLRGIDIDMVDVSDLVPTVAVVALFAAEGSRIRGVGFIRAKESDRLGDLARELAKCGASVAETDDGLIIQPAAMRGAHLATHHDHRLAMSFAVLAGRVAGVSIDDPAVVSKSWPGFWSVRDAMRATGS
jgi:3-phosphoshikimate 1-carboxyvinyltransferase